MLKTAPTAFILATSLLAVGCQSDSLGDDELDCASCDVAFGDLQVQQVAGLICFHTPTGNEVTCMGMPDASGTRLAEEFEGTVSVHPAPAIQSDSLAVDLTSLETGFELYLGGQYEPGTRYSLQIRDGSYYDSAHDDWVPFEGEAIVDPNEGYPVDDVLEAGVAEDIGLAADSKAAFITLPFERWDVFIIDNIRDGRDVELNYSITGDDAIRVFTRGEGMATYDSLVVSTDLESITLRLENGASLSISGPSVLVVEEDDDGQAILREVSEDELRF